jgi:light-regulated signal transduction histidine kinase (bacteriophytochrome)
MAKDARAQPERHGQSVDDLRQELERVQAGFDEATRELEAFSYSVSHDLRAPLRAIDGFSQALVADYGEALDEQGRHYLDRVRAGAQRMSELIDDLASLSRIHRSPLRRSRVNLSEIARRVVAELVRRDPERPVNVLIMPDLVANADSYLLTVMLEHLLENAWKFTSRTNPAEIAFGRGQVDGERHWFVKDNGAGFDMKYSTRLFSPFQRMHKASEFEGTGIGLATAQRVAARHGGRIWVEAKLNEGASFFFTLGGDDA